MARSSSINLWITHEQKRQWEIRSKRFGVKLSTFIRGKVEEHVNRKGNSGETDAERVGRVVTDQARKAGDERELPFGVNVRLEPEHARLIKAWAREEGIGAATYIRSILHETGNDVRAKRFFGRSTRAELAPRVEVVGTGAAGRTELDDLGAVIITRTAQAIVMEKARKWGVSAFVALGRIVEEAR